MFVMCMLITLCGGVTGVCRVYADCCAVCGGVTGVVCMLVTVEGGQVFVMCMLITVCGGMSCVCHEYADYSVWRGGRCLSCVC